MRAQLLWAVVVALLVLATQESAQSSITFRKIADTATAIPGGSGNFEFLGEPSLDAGSVTFLGLDSLFREFYSDDGESA